MTISTIILMSATLAFAVWFVVRWVIVNHNHSVDNNCGTPKMRSAEDVVHYNSMFSRPRGKFVRRDILPVVIITLLYAFIALYNLGNKEAPQSGWLAREGEDSQSIIFDLGQDVELYRIVHFNGAKHGNVPYSRILVETRRNADEPWVLWRTPRTSQDRTREPLTLDAAFNDVFYWRELRFDNIEDSRARYIRLTSVRTFQINEMAIYQRTVEGEGDRLDPSRFNFFGDNAAARLFDEQHLIPEEFTFRNQMYFDEIYHGRTAYEIIHGIYPYETTHPPLGKAFISLGIRAFGMTPFGWRIMGVLFSIIMLPLFYWLLKGMFDKTLIAGVGTTLLATEFMVIAQARIATIDTYAVFFIIASYLFMWRYITSGLNVPFGKTVLPLFFSGLMFGLGAASKWTVIYAGLGLLALYTAYNGARIYHAVKEKVNWSLFLTQTILVSFAFFIVVPIGIYVVSYAPYVQANHERIVYVQLDESEISQRDLPLELNRFHHMRPSGERKGLTIENLFDKAWGNSRHMFNYHSGLEVYEPHPFSANWYNWLINSHPMMFYRNWESEWNIENNQWERPTRSTIVSFNNPLISWAGLLALFAVAYAFIRKRTLAALFIVIGFLSQFLPWLLVPRETYAYHYYPSIIFLILALACLCNDLLDIDAKKNRKWVFAVAGVSIGLFIIFLPALTGITVPGWYSDNVMNWLPNWSF